MARQDGPAAFPLGVGDAATLDRVVADWLDQCEPGDDETSRAHYAAVSDLALRLGAFLHEHEHERRPEVN